MLSIEEEKKALQIAVQTERDGYRYYQESRERTDNPLLKQILESLAKDEITHEKLILEYFGKLSESSPEELNRVIEESLEQSSSLPTIFKSALENPEQQVAPNNTDREIFNHAIEFEKKGITFYQELESKAEAETAKRFYKYLKEMEQLHLDMLERSLQFLENPQQYFSENENWLLEG